MVDGVEETAISCYWVVTDGIDRCRVGFLKRHMVKHARRFDGALVQVTRVLSDDPHVCDAAERKKNTRIMVAPLPPSFHSWMRVKRGRQRAERCRVGEEVRGRGRRQNARSRGGASRARTSMRTSRATTVACVVPRGRRRRWRRGRCRRGRWGTRKCRGRQGREGGGKKRAVQTKRGSSSSLLSERSLSSSDSSSEHHSDVYGYVVDSDNVDPDAPELGRA